MKTIARDRLGTRRILAGLVLVVYCAAAGAGVGVTHLCCTGHSHLDREAACRSNDMCCVHGEIPARGHDDSELVPEDGSNDTCGCYCVFHVERGCDEHAPASQVTAASLLAYIATALVARIDADESRYGLATAVDYFPDRSLKLAYLLTVSLLI